MHKQNPYISYTNKRGFLLAQIVKTSLMSCFSCKNRYSYLKTKIYYCMVLSHVQDANTLVNRQNIRYNILNGTRVPHRAINRHISTKQDLPRCSLCGFAVDICKRYIVLFSVKIFKKEIPHGRTAYKNRRTCCNRNRRS